MELYNLAKDPEEANNVIAQHAEVVERLSQLANAQREELGDNLKEVKGNGSRDPGKATWEGEVRKIILVGQ